LIPVREKPVSEQYPGGRDLFSQAAPMCLTGNEFRRNSFIHSYKNSNRSLHFPLTGVESLSPDYWFIESACGSSRRASLFAQMVDFFDTTGGYGFSGSAGNPNRSAARKSTAPGFCNHQANIAGWLKKQSKRLLSTAPRVCSVRL
jgi:hypothetical protein